MRGLIERPRLTALMAGAVLVTLILGATGLGLRLPGVGFLDLFSDRTELDYESRYFEDFAPLRDSFVNERLGALGAVAGGVAPGVTSGPSAVTPSPGQRVSIEHAATNDAVTDAYAVPSVPFTATTTTARATREAGEPGDCSRVGGTLWYRYRPTEDLTLLANTFGTTYTTAVGVFSGSSLADLKNIRCDLATAGDARVGFRARSKETYYIQVSAPTRTGALVFSLEILGRTRRVSVSPTGQQGDSASYNPSISADGRYVAFHSVSSNLVSGQRDCPYPNEAVLAASSCNQVFVRDLRTKRTRMVSVTPEGAQGNALAGFPSISANGRFIAFSSNATDLVDPDRWPCARERSAGESCPVQIFVHDRVTRTNRLASVSSSRKVGDGNSGGPAISSDGRYVAFESRASNLAGDPGRCGGPTGGTCPQVYVHDFVTGKTVMASATPAGARGDYPSTQPSISGDGRFVAYASYALNLVKDTNEYLDILVWDRISKRTELASVSSSGVQGNEDSQPPVIGAPQSISGDGRYVIFGSSATNLVRGDTNDAPDVFVRDRLRKVTTRASVSSSGAQATEGGGGDGFQGIQSMGISPDGRYVGFSSFASTLVPGDANNTSDVFLRDTLRSKTVLVSVSSLGEQGDDFSWMPSLSSEAKIVAFSSTSSNIVSPYREKVCPTPNGQYCSDIYVHEGDPSI